MTFDTSPVIVGLSCRVAGARGNQEMWQALKEGHCNIRPIDPKFFKAFHYFDPHRSRRGKTYSLMAGQIDGVYDFDANFFNISPREAEQIDPQQRLMLQSVWEACEDAGLNPDQIAGPRTGVFIGCSAVENQSLSYTDPERGDSSQALGNTLAIIANRISSIYDFRGPSMVVDTACSSSLYALHLGSEAIRRGELDTAIIGGVHISRTAGGYVTFAQARMTSPRGICSAFDAEADGYVRAEASICVILQSPEAAHQMNARARARVLASAINTDGASSMITVPSQSQQAELLTTVLEKSAIDPDSLCFYEAHGTGTPVGDPIEAAALGEAVGQLRQTPLLIGSAKTNFGHAEPAAGLVGLAKVLLCFEHRTIAPSVNFHSANPAIPFDELNLTVIREARPLPPDQDAIAGINSFGFGGTNACMILQAEPCSKVPSDGGNQQPVETNPNLNPWLLLQAASKTSLATLAQSWALHLRNHPSGDWPALIAAQGAGSPFHYRLAIQQDPTLPDTLERVSHDIDKHDLSARVPLLNVQNLFTFAGNGSQTAAMGRREYETSAVFRQHFDRIAAAFLRHEGPDLQAALYNDQIGADLADPSLATPYLFAYQIAQAERLVAIGIPVDAVIGHSAGEIAALYFAGTLDLDTAVKIILIRSSLGKELRGTGTMAVISADPVEIRNILRGFDEPDLVVAAVNSPQSVTVSGPHTAIERLRAIKLKGRRLPLLVLKIDIPHHSPKLEPFKERFMHEISAVRFKPPSLKIYSAVTGRALMPGECNGAYLWKNLRNEVRFAEALEIAATDRPTCVIEISPGKNFANNVQDLARIEGHAIIYFSPNGLADTRDGTNSATDGAKIALAAWLKGARIAPSYLAGQRKGVKPRLPPYPWDERAYQSQLSANGIDSWGEKSATRLVGLNLERSTHTWLADVTPTHPSWVKDHIVGEKIVLPATVLIEMMLNVGESLWAQKALELLDFTIFSPVIIMDEGQRLRTLFDPSTERVTIHQRPRLDDSGWVLVAQASLRPITAAAFSAPSLRKSQSSSKGAQISGRDIYDALANRGLHYGPEFQKLDHALRGKAKEIFAVLNGQQMPDVALDPLALDSCLHALAGMDQVRKAFATAGDQPNTVLVPIAFKRLQLFHPSAGISTAKLTIDKERAKSIRVNLSVYDKDMRAIAEVQGLEFATMAQDTRAQLPRQRLMRRDIRLFAPQKPINRDKRLNRILTRASFAKRDVLTPGFYDVEFAQLRAKLAAKDEKAFAPFFPQTPQLAHDLRSFALQIRGAQPRYSFRHAQGQKALWQAAKAFLDHAVKVWPKDQRLNILITGMVDATVLRRFISFYGARIDQLWLSLGDGEDNGPLRQTLPSDLRPYVEDNLAPASVDLLIGLDFTATAQDLIHPTGIGVEFSLSHLQHTKPMGAEPPLWVRRCDDFSILAMPFVGKPSHLPPNPMVLKVVALPATTVQDIVPALSTTAYSKSSASSCQKSAPTHRIFYEKIDVSADLTQHLHALIMRLSTYHSVENLPLIIAIEFETLSAEAQAMNAALRAIGHNLRNESRSIKFGVISLFSPAPKDELWFEIISQSLIYGHVTWDGTQAKARLLNVQNSPPPSGRSLVMKQPISGAFADLTWQAQPLPRIGKHQVLLSVTAAALNYRDVMTARNILPERVIDFGATNGAFGIECVGRIKAVGKDVTGFEIGQEVIAFAAPSFATHVCANALDVIALPSPNAEHPPAQNASARISPAAAATIPVAFLTAWHSLVNIAQIGPNDRILLHGAAGALGLAAIQIAKLYGARVYATAGTEEKRLIAYGYGADHCFDSRSLEFADQIYTLTQGQGVTCVLNTLSGQAMRRSMDLLAPFGCFIELGKRDYLEATQISLAPFLRNLRYFGLDIDQYVSAQPHAAMTDMRLIAEAFSKGRLYPLPVSQYDAQDSTLAFQDLFGAHHIGKVVITPPTLKAPISARQKKAHVSGTWVLIGGNSTLGQSVAKGLREAGAQQVYAFSRSGTPNQPWGQSANDVNLSHMVVDASDPKALSAAFDQLRRNGETIKGVIHMAMVARDRPLAELDAHEVHLVLRAKLTVAQSIKRAITECQISPQLICFSSLSAVIGTTGQVAYSAANAAMEALTKAWSEEGLDAISIGWAPVRDAGYLSRDALMRQKIRRQNYIQTIDADELVSELIYTIGTAPPTSGERNYTFCAIDWDALPHLLPTASAREFTLLRHEMVRITQDETGLREALQSLSWAAALTRLEQEMRDILAKILRSDPQDFDFAKPFMNQGLDSLMALELRMELERRFGDISSHLTLSADTTASKLAVQLLKTLRANNNEQGFHNG